jgi:hypothetical protein
MNYTLWSKGTLLGRATPFSPFIQTRDPIMTYFHPADAWETTGAPLASMAREFPAISKNIAEMLKSPAFEKFEEPERSRQKQQALIDDPDHRRMRELKAAADALALELRDEQGRVVPRSSIMIIESPVGRDADDQLREAMAGLGIEPSALMLVASAGEPEAGSSGRLASLPSPDR